MGVKLQAALRAEIRATFSRTLAPRAAQLVRECPTDVPEDVLCSIIRASGGSLRLLRQDLAIARVDWRDALVAGLTRDVRRQLTDELQRAGLEVGPARRAVIEALTWSVGLPFDEKELLMRVRGRAANATSQTIVDVLVKRRWLHIDDRGRYTLSATKRSRR